MNPACMSEVLRRLGEARKPFLDERAWQSVDHVDPPLFMQGIRHSGLNDPFEAKERT